MTQSHDFEADIDRQQKGPLKGRENQIARLIMERWLARQRFGRTVRIYLTWLGSAVAVLVGGAKLWEEISRIMQ